MAVRHSLRFLSRSAAALMLSLFSAQSVIAAPVAVELSEFSSTPSAPWLTNSLAFEDRGRLRLKVARNIFSKQFEGLRRRVPAGGEFEAALEMLLSGRFEEALIIVDAALEERPNVSSGHELRGAVLAYLGRIDDSIAAFESAAALAPKYAGPLTKLGDIYLATNRSADARAAYQRAVTADPNDPRAQSRLGIALEAAGAYEEAIPYLSKSVADASPDKLSPNKIAYARALVMTNDPYTAISVLEVAAPSSDNFSANAILGMSYLAAKRYQFAIDTFKPLLEKQPDAGLVAYFLGRAYARSGKYQPAINTFQAAIAHAPNPSLPRRDLAAVYVATGALKLAEKTLKENIKGKTAKLFDYRLLGDISVNQRDFAAAESRFSKIVELFPEDAEGYHKLGTIQAAQTRYKDAAATFGSGLSAVGDDVRLLRSMIVVQSRLGDHASADLYADRLIALPRASAGSYALAGSVAEKRDNFEKAERLYRKAVEIDGDNVAALNNLGHVLALKGELVEARKLAERARKIDATSMIVAENLGWIAYQMDDYSAAVELLEEVTEKMEGNGRAHYRLGLALLAVDRSSSAVAAFEAAVNIGELMSEQEIADAKARIADARP